jgi:futalosine hydrolase
MKILLVSATQLEVQEYVLSAPHHDILITGVGMHAAVFELTHLLHHKRYDLVVQAGVAGAFSTSALQPGDVVAVAQDAFGDLGSFENKLIKSLQELNLSTEKEWLINTNPLLAPLGLPAVKGITLNTITDDDAYINALINKWQPDIETMEGAALHYVCTRLKQPYVQLRAISNFVGERDKSKWLLAGSITNLNNALKAILAKWTAQA